VVRTPFVQALAALEKAPGVRYQDHDKYAGYLDVTVTATHERFGKLGESADFSDKDARALVSVGGRDYLNYLNDPALKGWIYEPDDDEKNMGPSLEPYLPPAQLAAALTSALSQRPRLPVVGDKAAAAVTVNGTPAWRADTVTGYLYVTQSAPYRVLRWEPPSLDTAVAALNANPTGPKPRSIEADAPLTDSLGMDLTPSTDAAQLYGTVIQDTKDVATATAGASVQILQQNDGASQVGCSHTGCHVDVAFSGPVYNAKTAAYALGTVYIDLTVGSISTGGQQVGGCTSGPQPFQLTGGTLAGRLTCDNPQAGPAFDEANARNQAAANASGGTSEFSDYADDINLNVYVLTGADIDQLVAKEQHELQSLG
jgi:hypothetical protein